MTAPLQLQPIRHTMASLLALYLDKRMAKIVLLGIISGFPWVLIGSILTLWLKEEGFSRSGIGVFGLVFTVYAFNMLWAPLVDTLSIPFLRRLGQRRSWIVLMQIFIVLLMLAMAQFSPTANIVAISIVALLIAICSATQDVAVDALRIEMIGELEPDKVGVASAMATSGWWLGYGGLGALALTLADFFSQDEAAVAWQDTYLALIAVVLACVVLLVFLVDEDQGTDRIQAREADVGKMRELLVTQSGSALGIFAQPGIRRSLVVLSLLAALFAYPHLGKMVPGLLGNNALATLAADSGVVSFVAIWGLMLLYGGLILAILLLVVFLLRAPVLLQVGSWPAIFGHARVQKTVVLVGLLLTVAAYPLLQRAVPASIALYGSGAGFIFLWVSLVLAASGLVFLVHACSSLFSATGEARAFDQAAARIYAIWYMPARNFVGRHGVRIGLIVIALVILFKVGEAFLGRMSLVFYKEIGFSRSDIALYSKGYGTIALVAFTIIGSLINARYGLLRGLLVGGISMASTNLLFALLASYPEKWLFATAVVADQFTTALSTVALVAFLSQLCDRRYTATQYAALASLGNFSRTTLAAGSGVVVDALGGNWALFFVLTTLMVVPSLVLLLLVRKDLQPVLTGQKVGLL